MPTLGCVCGFSSWFSNMGICSRQIWQEEGELLHYLVAVVSVIPSGSGGSVNDCIYIWNN